MNFMMLTNTMDYSQPIEGFADKLSFGGMMVLVGMVAIFAVLTIIFLALTLFKVIFKNISKKKEKDTVVEKPVTELPVASIDQDEEIVAVIAAAIAMAESESNGVKFKVVSFRRV